MATRKKPLKDSIVLYTIQNGAPTINDFNYQVPTMWIDSSVAPAVIYELVNVSNTNVATWLKFSCSTSSISDWDGAITYTTDNFATYNGEIYVSLQNNNLNNQPDSSPAFWNLYLASLPVFSITDPAVNQATSTAIIDGYSGVIITLTSDGNDQTLQDPTNISAGKRFTVVVTSDSTSTINVNNIVISDGEAQGFIWDGAKWVAVTAIDAKDLTFTPYGSISALNVQDAIEELEDEKIPYTGASGNLDLGTHSLIADTIKINDIDDSNQLTIVWNENDNNDRILNLLLGSGNRSLTLNENLTIADGFNITLLAEDVAGQITLDNCDFEVEDPTWSGHNIKLIVGTDANASLTIEGVNGKINQDVTSDGEPSFNRIDIDNIRIDGNTISSTDSAGNIILSPDSTGEVVIGSGEHGIDYVLRFNGESNDGLITWKEDEDKFEMDCNLEVTGEINETDITIGAGKTLDVSAGTLTLADNQISGDKVEGGTIASITISQLSGAMDCNTQAMTNIDVDSGAIDGTTIGASTASTGHFTNYQDEMIVVSSKTDTYNVLVTDFGKSLRMNNVADKIFNLPSVGADNDGARLRLCKTGAGRVTIQAADTDKISDSNGGGTMYCDEALEIYAFLDLEYIHDITTWIVSGSGTWITT